MLTQHFLRGACWRVVLGCLVPLSLALLFPPSPFSSVVFRSPSQQERLGEPGCPVLCLSKHMHERVSGGNPLQKGKCCLGGKG